MATTGDGKITLKTEVDTSGIKKGTASIKKMVSAVGTAFGAISIAAAGATVAITKMAVSAYSEFEQLVGGAELMFGDAFETVMKNSETAFARVQMSQSEYLKQVNGFATGLKFALGGNEQAAAELADRIITAEADIVAATGQTQEAVQNAFNGIMKSEYTMIDNLLIGITPTKQGYQEMIDKVNEWNASNGKATKYQMGNLAQEQAALVDYIEMVGMKGYAEREAAETIQGSLAMTKSAWNDLLVAMSSGGDIERATNNLVYALDKFVNNIAPVVERTLSGVGQAIKNILPSLVQMIVSALIQQIPNLVVAVYNMIIGLFQGIVAGIKALFTGGTAKAVEVVKNSISGVSSGAGAAADNMNSVADATKKAGKEAKKTLAAFDEINILSSGSGSGGGSEQEQATPSVSAGGGTGGGGIASGMLSGVATEISNTMAVIMGIVGSSLVALGVILLCFGQIPWGIGLIVAGIASMGVSAFALADNLSPQMKAVLSGVLLLVNSFLIVIGIILICTGVGIPLGIGMIVAGAAGIASVVAINWNWLQPMIKGVIDAVFNSMILSAGLIVIGILLICTGAGLFLGLGILLLGLGSLGYQILTPNWDFIKEKVMSIWETLVNVWNTKIKPGLDKVQESWERLYNEHLKPVIDKLWGDMLKPFLEWLEEQFLSYLKTGFETACDGVVVAIDLAADAVSGFLDGLSWVLEFLTNIFAGDWEAAWDNIVSAFERIFGGIWDSAKVVINKVIDGINKMIDGINKVEFKAPDWVPGIGGKEFGANIPKIPRLARGAVIPPNREFLAVLGDQKQGTNIEAPADLIKQMTMEALIEVGASGQPTREEHYYLNETELMSVIYKLVKGGERIRGNSLVKGGAY